MNTTLMSDPSHCRRGAEAFRIARLMVNDAIRVEAERRNAAGEERALVQVQLGSLCPMSTAALAAAWSSIARKGARPCSGTNTNSFASIFASPKVLDTHEAKT